MIPPSYTDNRERLRKMGTVAGTVAKKVVLKKIADPLTPRYICKQENLNSSPIVTYKNEIKFYARKNIPDQQVRLWHGRCGM